MEVDHDVVHLHILVQCQLQVPVQQEEARKRLSEGAGGAASSGVKVWKWCNCILQEAAVVELVGRWQAAAAEHH